MVQVIMSKIVKKPSEFRVELFDLLEKSSHGDAVFVEHKEGTSVVIGLDEYNSLLDHVDLLKSHNQGLQDYIDGRTLTLEESKSYFKKKIEKWKKTKRKSS